MSKPNLLKWLLGLFFCFNSTHFGASAQENKRTGGPVASAMTVIKILPSAKNDTARIIVNGSQRIYKLPIKHKAKYLQRLKESLNKQTPVLVIRSTEQSDIILEVKKK